MPAVPRQRIESTFRRFDTSADGYIDRSELGPLLRSLGKRVGRTELVAALKQLDTNGDGKVTMDEFVAWFQAQNNPRTGAHVNRLLQRPGLGAGPASTHNLPPQTHSFGVTSNRDSEGAGDIMRWGGGGAAAGPRKDAVGGANAGQASAGTQDLLRRLRTEMKNRGAKGIIGLGRKFRIMDDDGSNSLSRGEFAKAMNEMQLGLTNTDIRLLFDHFDRDGSETIMFDEFLRGLRPPMNRRRLKLVRKAFALMDADGSGVIEMDDICEKYNAREHPDVRAGRRTEEEVLGEFMHVFEAPGDHDDRVTKEEWESYYGNISSSIEDDDYFELMIRNAWHMSGGSGQFENTTCRRVLVRHPDGSQSVQEVKDDLGVRADDTEGMMARLRAQGVEVADIELVGAVEDGNDENGGGSRANRVANANRRRSATAQARINAQQAAHRRPRVTWEAAGSAADALRGSGGAADEPEATYAAGAHARRARRRQAQSKEVRGTAASRAHGVAGRQREAAQAKAKDMTGFRMKRFQNVQSRVGSSL